MEGRSWGQSSTSSVAKLSWSLTALMNSPSCYSHQAMICRSAILRWWFLSLPACSHEERPKVDDSKLINSEPTDAPTVGVKAGAILDFLNKIVRIQSRANHEGRGGTQEWRIRNRIWPDIMMKQEYIREPNEGWWWPPCIQQIHTHPKESREGGGPSHGLMLAIFPSGYMIRETLEVLLEGEGGQIECPRKMTQEPLCFCTKKWDGPAYHLGVLERRTLCAGIIVVAAETHASRSLPC